MAKNKDKVDSLIELLFDPTADVSEQDDAAGYLGEYNDDRALKALVRASTGREITDFSVLQTCGESIAQIWLKRNHFDKELFYSLCAQARLGAYDYLIGNHPQWITQYNLHLHPDANNESTN